MRVLMISPHYPPDASGVGDYVALLARHLTAIDARTTIATSRGHAETGDGRVTVLPVIDDWGWPSLPRLCALALAGRYDLVHIQYQNEMYRRSAAITALPLALRALSPRTPVVVTVHDYGTPWPRWLRARAIAGPYGKAWFLVMLRAAARIILTNEQDEWRFTRQRPHYPVPPSRYAVVPVGSNLPEPPAHESGDVVGGLSVGYFGFVNPAKGVETLLAAFAAVRRSHPAARLTMICALRDDDAYQATIRRKLKTLGLSDGVTVTGELPDTVAAGALACCALVVLPFRDGVSLRRTTLMAALTLGRPVISTRSVVPPEALRDGRDLALVPPGDAPALARAIVALLDDPEERARLGANAREAAREFAWPAITSRTLDVYREALA
jgi:glycosyltransferase involved in cell wall biosynthesis